MKIIYFLPLLISLFSCTPKDDTTNILRHYDLKESKEFFLSSELREISGLAMVNDRLYAHNDERGIIYILDGEGKILSHFYPGVRPFKKDFEGIASDGKFIYLVTSAGVIYQVTASDSSDAPYKAIKTPLTDNYDVEGLCFDGETNSLLLVCKSYPQRKERNIRPVFSFDLESGKLINKPRFIISIDELKQTYKINNFSPSGIEKHPDGTFYVLSSDRKAIAVYDSAGQLIEAAILPSKHVQPEGITFLSNKNMIISDEGGKDDAELTIYSYKAETK
jgi:uncharacterized protein YjiK